MKQNNTKQSPLLRTACKELFEAILQLVESRYSYPALFVKEDNMNPFTVCTIRGRIGLRVFNIENENTCAQLCTQYKPNNAYLYTRYQEFVHNNVEEYQFKTYIRSNIAPSRQYVVTNGAVRSASDMLLQDTLCPQLLQDSNACLYCPHQEKCFAPYRFSIPDAGFVTFCKKQPTFIPPSSFNTWRRYHRLPLLHETKQYKMESSEVFDVIEKYHCTQCFFFTRSVKYPSETCCGLLNVGCCKPVHLHNIKKHLRNQYDHQTMRHLLTWADTRLYDLNTTLFTTGLTLFEKEPQCVFFHKRRRHFFLVKIPLNQLRGIIVCRYADNLHEYEQLDRDALETKFALYVVICSTQTYAWNHIPPHGLSAGDPDLCHVRPHEQDIYTIRTYYGDTSLTELTLYQAITQYDAAITQQKKEAT